MSSVTIIVGHESFTLVIAYKSMTRPDTITCNDWQEVLELIGVYRKPSMFPNVSVYVMAAR